MNNNNVITIGTALKWRGVYSRDKVYYLDNITADAGCIFRCKVSKAQGLPPTERIDEDGRFAIANNDIWDVVLDMSPHYNKIIDTDRVANEAAEAISKLSGSFDSLQTRFEKVSSKVTGTAHFNANVLLNTDQPITLDDFIQWIDSDFASCMLQYGAAVDFQTADGWRSERYVGTDPENDYREESSWEPVRTADELGGSIVKYMTNQEGHDMAEEIFQFSYTPEEAEGMTEDEGRELAEKIFGSADIPEAEGMTEEEGRALAEKVFY